MNKRPTIRRNHKTPAGYRLVRVGETITKDCIFCLRENITKNKPAWCKNPSKVKVGENDICAYYLPKKVDGKSVKS